MIYYIDKKTIKHNQYFRTYNSYSHILQYLFIHYIWSVVDTIFIVISFIAHVN